MAEDFDKVIDECVDRINRGGTVGDCLASYPEHADELEPLLRAILDTQASYTFTPSSKAKMAARQRFNAAREELARGKQKREPLFPRVLVWSKAWVAVAAVVTVALVGYFALKPMLFPIVPSPQPSQEDNLAFLISDDVNAIDDFQSLNVSISKIGLHLGDEESQWIELEPEVEVVDLTLLQGDKAQEIWRGNVPEGQYTKVFVHVSNVSGILEATGMPVSVRLPSERLQISVPFEITGDSIVNFVYDVTVIKAEESGQYILKPQVGQSGADQKFERIDVKGKGRTR